MANTGRPVGRLANSTRTSSTGPSGSARLSATTSPGRHRTIPGAGRRPVRPCDDGSLGDRWSSDVERTRTPPATAHPGLPAHLGPPLPRPRPEPSVPTSATRPRPTDVARSGAPRLRGSLTSQDTSSRPSQQRPAASARHRPDTTRARGAGPHRFGPRRSGDARTAVRIITGEAVRTSTGGPRKTPVIRVNNPRVTRSNRSESRTGHLGA